MEVSTLEHAKNLVSEVLVKVVHAQQMFLKTCGTEEELSAQEACI